MSSLALGPFFGSVSTQWSAESLALTPVVHERLRVNEPHAHQATFVTMLLDGQYREVAGRRSVHFDRYTAVYHPAGVEHQDSIGTPGARLLLFEFRPELLEGIHESRTAIHSMRDLSGSRAAWEILRLYRDATRGCDGLEFESRALLLVANLARLSTRIPRDLPSLGRARDYLHANFRRRMVMSEIADAAGIHPVYLGQMFRRETGERISDYVSRLRIRAAAEQLGQQTQSLAAVAFEHGFCDQSHFQRVFKKVTGYTPDAFRAEFIRS